MAFTFVETFIMALQLGNVFVSLVVGCISVVRRRRITTATDWLLDRPLRCLGFLIAWFLVMMLFPLLAPSQYVLDIYAMVIPSIGGLIPLAPLGFLLISLHEWRQHNEAARGDTPESSSR